LFDGPDDPKTPSSLASFKSRLVLPWYRLTQVVLEKRPLNGRSSSSSIKDIYILHVRKGATNALCRPRWQYGYVTLYVSIAIYTTKIVKVVKQKCP